MGLDKLKVITPRRPQSAFIDWVNEELKKRPEERRVEFGFSDPTTTCVHETTRFGVWTKSGTKPFWRVENQFIPPGGKLPPLATLETNPNNFQRGYSGVTSLLEIVFGEAFADLKISRIDCNADVEDVSVEYIRASARIPRKRKTGDVGRMQESYSNCGIQTFYVGKSPSQLRVYDKIQELRYHREDIARLPEVLTRIEWEFRQQRCPIRYWAEFPQLLDIQPFSRIQFLETSSDYDFRYDAKRSLSLFAFNKLKEEKGAHEAARVFNKASGRHFSRNLRDRVSDNVALRERIQAAYHASTKAFFENRPADVKSLYTQQSLVLNATPPIEISGSAAKPLLGATETQAFAIAAAGRRPDLLEESRVFDQHTLSESPLFSGFCPGQQLTLCDSDPESRK